MRDEDGFLTNPFPDMRDTFSTRRNIQQLGTLHFINMAIKEQLGNMNSYGKFVSHPYYPLFIKAAEPLIHELVDTWLWTEGRQGKQEGEELTPRNLTLAFDHYYRTTLDTGFFGEMHHNSLLPVAKEAIDAWTESTP